MGFDAEWAVSKRGRVIICARPRSARAVLTPDGCPVSWEPSSESRVEKCWWTEFRTPAFGFADSTDAS